MKLLSHFSAGGQLLQPSDVYSSRSEVWVSELWKVTGAAFRQKDEDKNIRQKNGGKKIRAELQGCVFIFGSIFLTLVVPLDVRHVTLVTHVVLSAAPGIRRRCSGNCFDGDIWRRQRGRGEVGKLQRREASREAER